MKGCGRRAGGWGLREEGWWGEGGRVRKQRWGVGGGRGEEAGIRKDGWEIREERCGIREEEWEMREKGWGMSEERWVMRKERYGAVLREEVWWIRYEEGESRYDYEGGTGEGGGLKIKCEGVGEGWEKWARSRSGSVENITDSDLVKLCGSFGSGSPPLPQT